ncbi:MAG: serine/threonine-protein kinase, partial [Actinocatenispora sp.]
MLVAGRYRLTEVLGRGGMGEVWLAHDQVLDRSVAVKLLARSLDDQAMARFTLEAQTAGRLSHPNVVSVLDFGTHEDRLFLVMERLDGRTVGDDLVEHGPFDPKRVSTIGGQVAAGLAAAHKQGVLHRDVKPANLLLAGPDRVKIGDFGIAQFIDGSGGLTVTGQLVGTSYYLAPERISSGPAVPASDVYGLGCVLYQLLAGEPPLSADTPLATLHLHLSTTPEPLRKRRSTVSRSLDGLVMAMLAKDPGERPTAKQVADVLSGSASTGFVRTLLAGSAASARSTIRRGPAVAAASESSDGPAPSWLRSRKLQVAVGGALVAGAAAVALGLG